MRTYTTFGSGTRTRILRTDDQQTAKAITTCDTAIAGPLAAALQTVDRELWAALHPAALILNGQPFETRRHLLGVFDTTIAGQNASLPGPEWERPHELITRLAQPLHTAPQPVRTAIRAELATLTDGLDGILVPATIVATTYRPPCLRLIVNPLLDRQWLNQEFSVEDDDPIYPVGGKRIIWDDEYELVVSCYICEPAFGRYEESGVAELIAESGEHVPYLLVRADHVRAYTAHHHPDLADRISITG